MIEGLKNIGPELGFLIERSRGEMPFCKSPIRVPGRETFSFRVSVVRWNKNHLLCMIATYFPGLDICFKILCRWNMRYFWDHFFDRDVQGRFETPVLASPAAFAEMRSKCGNWRFFLWAQWRLAVYFPTKSWYGAQASFHMSPSTFKRPHPAPCVFKVLSVSPKKPYGRTSRVFEGSSFDPLA